LIPDSHAHLDLIEQDTARVVSEAASAGVSPIVTIGITLESSARAVEAASRFDSVYAAVGIHPNDTAEVTDRDFERLEEIALSSEKVVAVGETGLDYYRDNSPTDKQAWAMREHIRLARRLGRALIIHDRQAHREVLDLLAEEGAGDPPVIMHCFSGDERVLAECVSRGYYISFAGPLTFRKSGETRRLAALAPADRLLVETDSPFLSPEPFRGRPNFPERVRLVAEILATVRSVTIEEMERILNENTAAVFGLSPGEE
jgi:TatD DNase family protein